MLVIFQIIKKDICRLKLLFLVWLLVLALQFVAGVFTLGMTPINWVVVAQFLFIIAQGLQMILTVVIVPLVIHSDSLVGTTAFWLTRPIARWQLITAKLVTLVVILVLLPLCIEVADFLLHGLPMSSILLLVSEVVIKRLSLVIPLTALAVVTSGFSSFAIVGISAYVLFVLSVVGLWSAYWSGFTFFANLPRRMNVMSASLADTIELIKSGIFITCCSAAIVCQFFTRRTTLTVIAIAYAVVGSMLIEYTWTYDLFRFRVVNEAQLPKSLKVEMNSSEVMISDDIQIKRMTGVRERVKIYMAQMSFDGLGANQFGILDDLTQAVISTPVGEEISSRELQFETYSDSYNVSREVIENSLSGAVLQNGSDNDHNYAEVFRISEDDFEKHKGNTGNYSGRVSVNIYEYKKSFSQPLRVGQVAAFENKQVYINDITRHPGKVIVMLGDYETNLLFDFNEPRKSKSEHVTRHPFSVTYILSNAKRQQAFVANENVLKSGTRILYWVTGDMPRLFADRDTLVFSEMDTQIIDEAWLKDAELIRIDAVKIGKKEANLETESFTLVSQYPRSE